MTTQEKATERPILMSAPMVKAILAGRKTQTRRVIKPQPDDDGLWNDDDHPRSIQSTLTGWNGTVDSTGESKEFICRYGKVGDVLWVRESWNRVFERKRDGQRFFKAPLNEPVKWWIEYAAWPFKHGEEPPKWKPSIHMPKKVARLWLKVTGVRVERVHDISEKDAIAEGIHFDEDSGYWFAGDVAMAQTAVSCYRELWEEINGKDSWDSNPWVWVIEFERK